MRPTPAYTVRLWGVRGSVPAPGSGTRRHGGNTSCVSVRTAAGHWLVFDAGTGARALGNELLRTELPGGTVPNGHLPHGHLPNGRLPHDAVPNVRPPDDAHEAALAVALFLTHVHWDHVQGLPFFAPLYDPRFRLTVYAPDAFDAVVRGAMHRQMCPPS